MGFPGGSDSKESACNAGDLSSVPEFGRFPGERNDTPLWYSCLENSMDRRAWWSAVHGVTKESDMTEQPTFQCLSFVNGFLNDDRTYRQFFFFFMCLKTHSQKINIEAACNPVSQEMN